MAKEVLYSIVGLVAGIALTLLVTSGKASDNQKHESINHNIMDMSMSEMSKELKTKTGDEFDKAFIEQMIPHHEGAIDMAELAIQNAEHQEIKDLARDIIEAQKSEIDMMKDWQTKWGY